MAGMVVERVFDGTRINAMLRHPEVREWVTERPDGRPPDVSAIANNPDIYLLEGEFGAAILTPVIIGTAELHSVCLPEGRGEWVYSFGRAVLDWVFSRAPIWEVCTRIPKPHLAAKGLARANGFRPEFTSPNPCLFRGERAEAETWSLSIHSWIARSRRFAWTGEWLHRRLREEAEKLGVTEPGHVDDAYHNAVTGCALECAKHGQLAKSIFLFNRWAILARHATISLMSADPVKIRMDLGVMSFRDGDDIEVTRDEVPPG